jgi:hypothetical protein
MTIPLPDRERDEVIAEIEKAFDGVSREDGITLHEARALDDYRPDDERAEARKQDTETRWQEVPAKWIEELGDDFTFLDAKGARYYLPAFMVWSLRGGDPVLQASWGLFSHLLHRTEGDAFQVEMFRLLSREQKKAVARFLQFVANHRENYEDESDDALRARTLYWGEEQQ